EMHRFIPAMASLAAARVAEIEVRHHPRRFGRSKYGFSRIYKVLADLLAIRTILSFSRRPMAWLGAAAGTAGLLALLALAISLRYGLRGPPQPPSVVFAGITVLLASLMIFALALGLLGHLIYRSNDHRLRRFLAMSARRLPADPAIVAGGS